MSYSNGIQITYNWDEGNDPTNGSPSNRLLLGPPGMTGRVVAFGYGTTFNSTSQTHTFEIRNLATPSIIYATLLVAHPHVVGDVDNYFTINPDNPRIPADEGIELTGSAAGTGDGTISITVEWS